MLMNTYLLLTEVQGCTVSYGLCFLYFNLWPGCEARRPCVEVEKTRCHELTVKTEKTRVVRCLSYLLKIESI